MENKTTYERGDQLALATDVRIDWIKYYYFESLLLLLAFPSIKQTSYICVSEIIIERCV